MERPRHGVAMSDIADVNIRRLDGLLLLVFRELMRHRNASTAAKRLGLSQSGASHALARLRDTFGDPLFMRRSHGLEPTGLALEFAPKIEALIALAQDALGGATRFDPARSTRQFHVGAAEFLISLTAARVLRLTEREAPNASVVFRHFLGQEAVGALQRGEIDIALGQFNALPDTIVRETMFTDRYVVLARKDHPALRDGLDVSLFGRLSHVSVSAVGDAGQIIDPVLASLGVRRRVVGVVPRYLTAFGVVAATDAVVMAPRMLAERYAEDLGLMAIAPPFDALPFEICAIRLRETSRDAGAAWLLDRLRTITNAPGDTADDTFAEARLRLRMAARG